MVTTASNNELHNKYATERQYLFDIIIVRLYHKITRYAIRFKKALAFIEQLANEFAKLCRNPHIWILWNINWHRNE